MTDKLLDSAPWDKRDNETAPAYYWLCRYIELHPNERSIPRLVSDAIDRGLKPPQAPPSGKTGAAAHRRGHDAEGRVPSMLTLKRWSAQHEWERRAGLRDQEAEQRKRLALEEEMVEAARRHALQTRLALNVLTWPLQRFWERAMSQDPAVREALVGEFEEMSGPALLQLGASVTRAVGVLQAAEREALGMKAAYAPSDALDEDDVEDYAGTIQRYAAVLAALEAAGYAPVPADPG